jgi:predicted dehydrogenase
MVNIAIVGAGSAGTRLGEYLLKYCGLWPIQLRFVRRMKQQERNPYGDERLHKDLCGVETMTDLEAGCEWADGVIIANPTSRHLPAALVVAEVGKHMLIEKPLGSVYYANAERDRARALLSFVKEKRLAAMVSYNLRFHPLALRLREWLAEIGEIRTVRTVTVEDVRTWHPWEKYETSYAVRKDLGGGVIATQSHEVDLLHWLFGKPVSLVTNSSADPELGGDVETLALSRFAYPGFTVEHLVSYVGEKRRTFSVEGSLGTIEWDMATCTIRLNRYESEGPAKFERGDPDELRRLSFVGELEYFLRHIAGVREHDFAKDVEVFNILRAMYESASNNGAVVTL